MRGNLVDIFAVPGSCVGWEILNMEFTTPNDYNVTFWSGSINETRIRFGSCRRGDLYTEPLQFYSALALNKARDRLYGCANEDNYEVSVYRFVDGSEENSSIDWRLEESLPRYENDEKEMLLQLRLDQKDRMLLGTAGKGFVLWDFGDREGNRLSDRAMYLALPHGVRNITTKIMQSNSIMVSSKMDYAVAGVRKNLYVWCLQSLQLAKVLDAHFGRIIQLEALTIGNWNNVVTSSIDRSVKVWNINNIFEKVHVIDRHELQIDDIRCVYRGLLKILEQLIIFKQPFRGRLGRDSNEKLCWCVGDSHRQAHNQIGGQPLGCHCDPCRNHPRRSLHRLVGNG